MQSIFTFIAVVAVILILCAALGARDRRQEEARLRSRLIRSFGAVPDKKMDPQRYERVPAWFHRHPPADAIDDITWNDLDLDLLFARMDSTCSSAGEEYLYALLRSPVREGVESEGAACRTDSAGGNKEDLRKDRAGHASAPEGEKAGLSEIALRQIRFFEEEENQDVRLQLQMALSRFGHAGRYSIYEYLELLDEAKRESSWRHLPAFLLPAVSIALLFVSVPLGVLCLLASLVFNMATYYRRKGEIEPYLVSFAYLLRMLQCADAITEIPCEAIRKEQEELCRLQPSFQRFRRGSGILLSGSAATGGNVIDLLADYVRILFHIDLIKFNTMLREARGLQNEIDAEMTLLGKIDAMIALASFKKSLPYSCEAVLHEDAGSNFCAEGLYHPLLKHPVANDLKADRPILLTGSNASGKSTLLKAAALCALLAQTVGFCPAASYEGSVFRIRSSMALRDSIRSGESYFMVEIRSLKRIVDLSGDGGLPVLCCIDEVLRGTNTIERIAASTEILRLLSRRGVLCLAATHDIELASLLKEQFENLHFEEEIEGGDVVFSYRLKKGCATGRNAIRLLGVVGFDPGITEEAQRRAERFEQTGQWSD